MHRLLFSTTQIKPICADLDGGMDGLPDTADITTGIRLDFNKKAALDQAITSDNSADFKIVNATQVERVLQ